MKKQLKLLLAIFLSLVSYSSFASTEIYGHTAAVIDKNLTINSMLTYAIQDEYLSHSEYENIISSFGSFRPFNNIVNAESRHISMLKMAFINYNLPIPPDNSMQFIVHPNSIENAYKISIDGEIGNIAMYNHFLAESSINLSENKSLQNLFDTLKNASQRHLQAFQQAYGKSE